MPKKEIEFLLIEDDDIDAKAFERSMREHKIGNSIVRARDGKEALSYLRGNNAKNRHQILMLDISMPRMNGFEFLEILRNDDALKHHIVFVLTTSNNDIDRMRAYQKCISGYIVKANAGEDFVQLMKLLDDFILCVEFPE